MDLGLIWTSLPQLLAGAGVTLFLSLFSLVLGGVIGLIIALMRVTGNAVFRSVAVSLVTVLRGTPLLIQLFLVYYGLPQIGIVLDNYTVALAVLSLYMGAYLSEIIRGAIEAIDVSQIEGAYSLGLSYWQAMRIVILPQAFRLTIPPSANQFISMLKESSLVSTIAILELTFSAQRIVSFTFRPVELYLTAAAIYLVMTTGFSALTGWLEGKVAIPGLELKR
jgi:His/Glu/Gln/Arg/opine family amino acid ABC transporter permease subunit